MKTKEEIQTERSIKEKAGLELEVKRLSILNNRYLTEHKRLQLKLREQERRYQQLERELLKEKQLHRQQILENKRLEDKWFLESQH